MSLINQVLKDLDQRQTAQAADGGAGLDDLYVVGNAIHTRNKNHRTVIALVSVVLIGLVTVMVYGYKKSKTTTSTPDVKQQTVYNKETPAVISPKIKKIIPTPSVQTRQQVSPELNEVNGNLISSKDKPAARTKIKKQVPLRPEQKAELAYQSGYDYVTRQQYQKGEKQLRKAIATTPGHAKARELLAGILIKQGRWVEATEVLRHGISISPNHRPFIKLYARSLMQMNQDSKAIALLRQYSPSIQADPEHYALLAALYQRQKDHSTASNTYAEILKVRPQMGIWWVGMGISLEALGQHSRAQQAYQRARTSGSLHGDIARFTDNRLIALDEINLPFD